MGCQAKVNSIFNHNYLLGNVSLEFLQLSAAPNQMNAAATQGTDVFICVISPKIKKCMHIRNVTKGAGAAGSGPKKKKFRLTLHRPS